MAKNNYILYQAYGKDEICAEAVFSILSLLRFTGITETGFRIIIYTDKPEYFESYFGESKLVSCRQITENDLTDWRGNINFVHRVKIKIILDFFSTHSGNLLYVDTDTYFKASPLPLLKMIEEGKLLMHICEGKIESKKNPIFRKVYAFLKKNKFTLNNGKQIQIPTTTEMWNAGVLGMNHNFKHLVDKVLQLTDLMYSKYPKHIMEQLAFSYFFQTDQPVTATEATIYHYWDFKGFRLNIIDFLTANKDKTIEEKAALTANNPPWVFKPENKEKKNFWQKFFG